jgi:hypothetical protein
MLRKASRETIRSTRQEQDMGMTRDNEFGGVVELDLSSSAEIA